MNLNATFGTFLVWGVAYIAIDGDLTMSNTPSIRISCLFQTLVTFYYKLKK